MHDNHLNDATGTLLKDLLKEKRAERRWKNIRFIAWFALLAYSAFMIFHFFGKTSSSGGFEESKKGYAALIRLDGLIAPGRDFSANELLPVLQQAFKDKEAKGVIISINSPGGTPVQAAIIHDAILSLKEKYHKKTLVVGEDMLTSGAYYVAVAADKIYVNPNTITGSIGVIMKGFGFVELMKKIGIERRVYSIGPDKDRLDPFLPQNAADLQKIKSVMEEVHENFAKAVIAGRKGKLGPNPRALFTGDFWSGQTALRLGLVDGLGNLMDAMEKEFHTTQYKEYGSGSGLIHLLGGQLNSTLDHFFMS